MPVINPGDILYVKRTGYRHFGIYAGNQQVIHYYKEKNPLVSDGIISETTLADFQGVSDTIYVLNSTTKAGAPLFDWIVRRLLGDDIELFSPEETVARARSKLGERGYNLLLNNCEHFALWCKTGIAQSAQSDYLLSCLQQLIPLPSAKETD
ncbi:MULTISPECIES: lecithin retinol acyltransferase family protein [Selenomonas]|uniref:Lecithin retinol acyltransferase family protein n=1 Tax=Selenomonas ruminis TaxID=2593411 RepID=A0A5D6W811_9FIRM|nr:MULTISPECIES: lecithin retinol acyltransferase family protein [unclassified Selenomonas]MBQ1867166.1 lecithin retinol acyltransferase family protein [Selenomonas sp.]TYZ24611.1 lecithin retinol acyltransferase family protein [Selenomonas sp. mPRGC5]